MNTVGDDLLQPGLIHGPDTNWDSTTPLLHGSGLRFESPTCVENLIFSRKIGTQKSRPGPNSRQPLSKAQKKFNWKHFVRAYQLEGIEAQLLMRDGLVRRHWDGQDNNCTLHDEQTFRDKFGLKAIAVNSSNGGCKPEVLQVMSYMKHA
ncbi:hypothetical protein B0H13DRAFT_1882878 [Mycena leptocephala]|nr:hypothetical protein B0H13DRAFT_1882878 [Mycena leptocephala]